VGEVAEEQEDLSGEGSPSVFIQRCSKKPRFRAVNLSRAPEPFQRYLDLITDNFLLLRSIHTIFRRNQKKVKSVNLLYLNLYK
jgi:hypothetical protein